MARGRSLTSRSRTWRRMGPDMRASEALARQTLLRGLPAAEIDALRPLVRSRVFQAGEVLFRAGDLPDCVYFIVDGAVDGAVEVVLESINGRHPLARIAAGECIGEMAALDGEPRSATVVAVEQTHTLCVAAADFVRFLEMAPVVSARLLRQLAARLRRSE